MTQASNSARLDALCASFLEWLGDEDLARDLALTVLKDIPTQLADISDAIDSGDFVVLHSAAHRLKGAMGVFGEHSAFVLAGQLETLGREERIDEARALMPVFESAVFDFSCAAELLIYRLVQRG